MTTEAAGVILAYGNGWHGANCDGNFLFGEGASKCSCGLRDWVAAVENQAAEDALAKARAAVLGMKACAPDGDFIRWDIEHADPSLHYVNRVGVLNRLTK